MRNKIPRKFNRLTVKIKIKTSESNPGDIFHIFKNDLGYLGLNLRTGKYCYMFVSMLRNGEISELMEVI